MENQLQTVNNSLSTLLNHKEVEIAKLVWHVNQLIAYPLVDSQIEAWAKSLNKLLPDLDLLKLEELINNMKIGEIEWDTRKGIQNLFINLRVISDHQNHYINHDNRP